MPVYDYKCEKGHEFSLDHGINEEPIQYCQQRGTGDEANHFICIAPCKRQISTGTGFTLKGGGWGRDGYR